MNMLPHKPCATEPQVLSVKPVATVISVYMDNVDQQVVEYQRRCVTRHLPEDWAFVQQYCNTSHATALERSIANSQSDLVVLLDIDCIPLRAESFTYLHKRATDGTLVGAAQRATHIANNSHIYVGPFCMAFSRAVYAELGSPSFAETERGDIGEELTYRWEQLRRSIALMWPSHVERNRWLLAEKRLFGFGTTYEDLFYHAFCIRDGVTTRTFLAKCKQMLGEASEVE